MHFSQSKFLFFSFIRHSRHVHRSHKTFYVYRYSEFDFENYNDEIHSMCFVPLCLGLDLSSTKKTKQNKTIKCNCNIDQLIRI